MPLPVPLLEARLAGGVPPIYQRHQPGKTLLYQIVERFYPAFLAQLETEGRTLPDYVRQEFSAYLKCGRLEHGFLRVRCESCHHEKLVAFSCKKRGFCPSCSARRMVESAALNLNIHFHMLFLDGGTTSGTTSDTHGPHRTPTESTSDTHRIKGRPHRTPTELSK